jgi:hypothetical protein
MLASQWEQFMFLYPRLAAYCASQSPGSDDPVFTDAWNSLRLHAVEAILNRLADSRTFDDFVSWLRRLAVIVTDRHLLWGLLHTEVVPSLKVTQEESDRICTMFFLPEMRFEFGLVSFLQCSLCSTEGELTMARLIDTFYCVLGYIDSCHLPQGYVAKDPHYAEFLEKLLLCFLRARGCDARRFVWMVEKINEFGHLSDDGFHVLCNHAIQAYVAGKTSLQGLARLQGMLIISTSPALQEFPSLRVAVGKVFQQVITEQHEFAHRYVFGSFGTLVWNGYHCEQPPDEVSCPVRSWRLCLSNLSRRVKARPEIPETVIVAFLDDSLAFLEPYYGEVQPSRELALRVRMDIVAIVSTIADAYPGTMPLSTKQKLWFLLLILAITGASDADLRDVRSQGSPHDQEVFLGLDHNDRGFLDCHTALCMLGSKFESDFEDSFASMAAFLRHNLTQT